MARYRLLAGFLLLVFAAAGVGGWLTSQGVGDWYRSLNKPTWNPPSWVFGPVWTALYVTIAVAGWRVALTTHPAKRRALALWGGQMTLNVLWSACFFAWKNPGLALLEILALWFAILATIRSFLPIHRPAALLLIPYLLWVTFATLLNGTIWWLNR